MTISEDSYFEFDAPIKDADEPSLELTFSAPSNGVIESGNGAAYRYTPDANFTGDDSFTVTDSVNQKTITISVHVTAVNDAPSQQLPPYTAYTKGGVVLNTRTFLSDIDDTTATMRVTISVDHGGTLMVSSNVPGGITSGQIINNGTSTVTLEAPLAVVNATLGADYSVTFGAEPNYQGSATLTITTNDLGNSGTGGALTTTDTTVLMYRELINEVPEPFVMAPNANAQFTGGVTSVGSDFSQFELSLAVWHGTISSTQQDYILANFCSSWNVELSGLHTATLSVSGPAWAVSQIMSHGFYYTPDVNYQGTDMLTMVSNDLGTNISGVPLTDTDTIAIRVGYPINQTPVNTVPGPQDANEDSPLSIIGLAISDLDAAGSDVTIILNVTQGMLTISTTVSGGLTVEQINGNDSGVVTITAPVAAINATLGDTNGLYYRGSQDFNGTDLLTITTNDLGNTGYGGPQTDTDTVAITVRAVNDAPVNTIPDSQTVNEDSILSIAGLSISDIDAGTASVTVTLSVGSGTLSIRSNVSVGVTAGQISGNGSGTVTITAPISMINATLANVSGVSYLGNPNFNGTDALTIQTNDRGNTGSGGPIVTNNELAIEVLSVDDPPVGESYGMTISEDSYFEFDAPIKDADEPSLELAFSAPSNGVIESGNGAAYRYTPDANFTGDDSFTVTDSVNQKTITISVHVTAVNDAPSQQLPPYTAYTKGGVVLNTRTFLSDIDDTTATMRVTISVDHGGTLMVSSNVSGGVTSGQIINNGTSTVTLEAPLAVVNATLGADYGVTFGAEPNYQGSATLTITTNDLGNSGTGGALTTTDTTVLVYRELINEVPEPFVMAPNANAQFTGGVTSVDSDFSQFELSLAVWHGTISSTQQDYILANFCSSWNVELSGLHTATLSVSGPAWAVSQIMSHGFYYTPDVNYQGTDMLTMVSNDLGTNISGVPLTDTDTIAIRVGYAPVNLVPESVELDEDCVTAIAGVSISTANEDNSSITVTLSVSYGFLSLNTQVDGGLTSAQISGSGSRTVRITAPLSSINATLANASGLLYVGEQDFNGSDILTITSNDLGSSGFGVPFTDTDTVAVTIRAINDAPINTVPSAQTVSEDTAMFISGISISDVDAGTGIISVTLSVGNGKLTIRTDVSGGTTSAQITGNGSDTVTITASLAAINVTLADASGLSYLGNLNFNGSDVLTVTTNDLGNTGTPGALTGSDTVSITVHAVNDAPTNTLPGAQAVNEDAALLITGILISDVDAGGANISVTLIVGSGNLSVATNVGGGVTGGQVTGNGSGTVTITAPIAAINATLAHLSGLSYLSSQNYYGTDALTVTTNDLGNSGYGGALTDTEIVNITVNAAEDRPSVQAPSAYFATEDITLTLRELSVTDADAGTATVLVTFSVATGTLTMLSTAIGGLTAGQIEANGTATIAIRASLGTLNASLLAGKLRYSPESNWSGTSSLTVVVEDRDSQGALDPTPYSRSIPIVVDAVNDAPTITSPRSVPFGRTTATAIAGMSIADIDAGTSIVQVTLSATAGALLVNSSVFNGIAAGQMSGNGTGIVIITAAIEAINLTLADANGVAYTAPSQSSAVRDVLTIFTSDLGAFGSGGAATATSTVVLFDPTQFYGPKTPALVKDINDVSYGSSNPTELIRIGEVLYFAAGDGVTGQELWRYSEQSGLERVRDIRPGINSSEPRYLTNVNGTLYFSANNGVDGRELIRYDGTTSALVFNRDQGSGAPKELTPFGGYLYFTADDGLTGRELWRTALAGTTSELVVDVATGRTGSSPTSFVIAGDRLFFTASLDNDDVQLWTVSSDTSGSSVSLLQTFPKDSAPNSLTNLNGNLYFNAGDPTSVTQGSSKTGRELWTSDGTSSGTHMLLELRTGFNATTGAPLASNPRNLYYWNSSILFNATGNTGGSELWKTDGTSQGTILVRDLLSGSSNPGNFVEQSGKIYFTTTPSATVGQILWATDGTSNGTTKIYDFGFNFSSNGPSLLTVAGGSLFFVTTASPTSGSLLWKTDGTSAGTSAIGSAFTAAGGISTLRALSGNTIAFDVGTGTDRQLWVSDGTSTGTTQLFSSSATALFEPGLDSVSTLTNGAFVVAANNHLTGIELWTTNGTSTGTKILTDLNTATSESSYPVALASHLGRLFFAAQTAGFGAEPFTSDGTSNGTTQLADIFTGSGSSTPRAFVNLNGTVLFVATSDEFGRELWKTDGTLGGTTLVKDIKPGSASASIGGGVVLNNRLYFAANDGISGIELFQSDGTSSGTTLVLNINPTILGDGTPGDSSPGTFRVFSNHLLFRANDGVHGSELWITDGTSSGTHMVADINAGSVGSSISTAPTVVGNIAFFVATGPQGRELYRTDGTSSGTWLVKDIHPAGDSAPTSLINYNGVLIFAATDATAGRELWRSDGTSSGTYRVADISALGDSSPTNFAVADGWVYFSANDGVHGHELWRSDGTSSGTNLLIDIRTQGSVPGSYPGFLRAVGGTLYFTADDGQFGTELWQTDLRTGATNPVLDINVNGGSMPSSLTFTGNRLYFSAYTGLGTELWSVDLAPNAAAVSAATTNEDVMTNAGLVVSRNQSDGAEVNYFRVSEISHGTLFRADGVTPVYDGDYLAFGDGSVQLRFLPKLNSTVAGSFTVTPSIGTAASGLGVHSTIATITVVSVDDPTEVHLPTTPQSIRPGSPIRFSPDFDNAITLSDVDSGNVVVTLRIEIPDGSLSLGSSTAPATVVSGLIPSPFIEVTGSISDINKRLEGLTVYQPSVWNSSTLPISFKIVSPNQSPDTTTLNVRIRGLVSIEDSVLYVTGTQGDDIFGLTALPTGFVVAINGDAHSTPYSGVSQVVIIGMGGSDSFYGDLRQGNQSIVATLSPQRLTIHDLDQWPWLEVYGPRRINIQGGIDDRAVAHDSTDNDMYTFLAGEDPTGTSSSVTYTPSLMSIAGPGFLNDASGFGELRAEPNRGGRDVAVFHMSSRAADEFSASAGWGIVTTNYAQLIAQGVKAITAVAALFPERHSATIYDTDGNDRLFAYPAPGEMSDVQMVSSDQAIQVVGFGTVAVVATEGLDEAFLQTNGNTTVGYSTSSGTVTMTSSTPSFTVQASGFDHVYDDTVTIDVPNHAPWLFTGVVSSREQHLSLNLSPLVRNQTNSAGASVYQILDSIPVGVTSSTSTWDEDDNRRVFGIAVVGVDESHGRWEYTTDGSFTAHGGNSWQPLTGLADSHALLLGSSLSVDDPTQRIRFIPNPDFSGYVPQAIRFRAWDLSSTETSGTYVDLRDALDNSTLKVGGDSAYSVNVGYAGINVVPFIPVTVSSASAYGGAFNSSGLEVSHEEGIGVAVLGYRITNIANGRLYLLNATTELSENTFVSSGEAVDGLRFRLDTASYQDGVFTLTPSTTGDEYGLALGSATGRVQRLVQQQVHTAPSSFLANEDTAVAVTGIHIDYPLAYGNMQVTLSSQHGSLLVATDVSAGLTTNMVIGSGSPHVTITAPLDVINRTLASSQGLRYEPGLDYFGTDSIVFTSVDLGLNGYSQQSTVATTIPGTIVAINDAPTVFAIDHFINGDNTLEVAPFAISDVDAGTSAVQVTITSNGGTLVLSTGVAGGVNDTMVTGNSSSTISITASLQAISNTLNAAKALVYLADSPLTQSTTISVTANDLGASGEGGPMEVQKTITVYPYVPIWKDGVVTIPGTPRSDIANVEFSESLVTIVRYSRLSDSDVSSTQSRWQYARSQVSSIVFDGDVGEPGDFLRFYRAPQYVTATFTPDPQSTSGQLVMQLSDTNSSLGAITVTTRGVESVSIESLPTEFPTADGTTNRVVDASGFDTAQIGGSHQYHSSLAGTFLTIAFPARATIHDGVAANLAFDAVTTVTGSLGWLHFQNDFQPLEVRGVPNVHITGGIALSDTISLWDGGVVNYRSPAGTSPGLFATNNPNGYSLAFSAFEDITIFNQGVGNATLGGLVGTPRSYVALPYEARAVSPGLSERIVGFANYNITTHTAQDSVAAYLFDPYVGTVGATQWGYSNATTYSVSGPATIASSRVTNASPEFASGGYTALDAPYNPANPKGTLVSDLMLGHFDTGSGSAVGSIFVDADAARGDVRNMQGIAVTSVSDGNWEYSLDDGRSWTPFSKYTLEAFSATRALLLPAWGRLRAPYSTYNQANPVQFRLWDQTYGRAGELADLNSTRYTLTGTPVSATSTSATIITTSLSKVPTFISGGSTTSELRFNEDQTSANLLTVRPPAIDDATVLAQLTHYRVDIPAGLVMQVNGMLVGATVGGLLLRQELELQGFRIFSLADVNGEFSLTIQAFSQINSAAIGDPGTLPIVVAPVNDPIIIDNQKVSSPFQGTPDDAESVVSSVIQVGPVLELPVQYVVTGNIEVTNGSESLFAILPYFDSDGALHYQPAGVEGAATVLVEVSDSPLNYDPGFAPSTQTISMSFVFTRLNDPDLNDAPINRLPTVQRTLVDTPLPFSHSSGNAISVCDVDAGSSDVSVTLSATHGLLALSPSGGVTIIEGNGSTGSATLVLSGAIDAINSSLDSLVFLPEKGFSGIATLGVLTNDLGFTGNGGALTATSALAILVDGESVGGSAGSGGDTGSGGGGISDYHTKAQTFFANGVEAEMPRFVSMSLRTSNGIVAYDGKEVPELDPRKPVRVDVRVIQPTTSAKTLRYAFELVRGENGARVGDTHYVTSASGLASYTFPDLAGMNATYGKIHVTAFDNSGTLLQTDLKVFEHAIYFRNTYSLTLDVDFPSTASFRSRGNARTNHNSLIDYTYLSAYDQRSLDAILLSYHASDETYQSSLFFSGRHIPDRFSSGTYLNVPFPQGESRSKKISSPSTPGEQVLLVTAVNAFGKAFYTKAVTLTSPEDSNGQGGNSGAQQSPPGSDKKFTSLFGFILVDSVAQEYTPLSGDDHWQDRAHVIVTRTGFGTGNVSGYPSEEVSYEFVAPNRSASGYVLVPADANIDIQGPTSGKIKFAKGATSTSFYITAKDDSIVEWDETVVLELIDLKHGSQTASHAVSINLTILDNDGIRANAPFLDRNSLLGADMLSSVNLGDFAGFPSIGYAPARVSRVAENGLSDVALQPRFVEYLVPSIPNSQVDKLGGFWINSTTIGFAQSAFYQPPGDWLNIPVSAITTVDSASSGSIWYRSRIQSGYGVEHMIAGPAFTASDITHSVVRSLRDVNSAPDIHWSTASHSGTNDILRDRPFLADGQSMLVPVARFTNRPGMMILDQSGMQGFYPIVDRGGISSVTAQAMSTPTTGSQLGTFVYRQSGLTPGKAYEVLLDYSGFDRRDRVPALDDFQVVSGTVWSGWAGLSVTMDISGEEDFYGGAWNEAGAGRAINFVRFPVNRGRYSEVLTTDEELGISGGFVVADASGTIEMRVRSIEKELPQMHIVGNWKFGSVPGVAATMTVSAPSGNDKTQFVVTNPNGEERNYDAFGKLISVVDRNGNRTEFKYRAIDAAHRDIYIESVQEQGKPPTTFEYVGIHPRVMTTPEGVKVLFDGASVTTFTGGGTASATIVVRDTELSKRRFGDPLLFFVGTGPSASWHGDFGASSDLITKGSADRSAWKVSNHNGFPGDLGLLRADCQSAR